MNAPKPDLPLALRATTLITAACDPIRPSLKLNITHHYHVQSTLISSNTKALRLDDTLDAVVPIGGKVEIGLHIDDQLLMEGGRDGEGEGDVVQRVRGKLAGMLQRQNSDILALLSTRPVAQSRTDPNTLILTPISSLPTLNPIRHQCIPSGHPYAYLKRLDVRFSWIKTRTRGKRKLELDEDMIDDVPEEGDGLGEPDLDELVIDDVSGEDDGYLPPTSELGEDIQEGESPVEDHSTERPTQSWLDQQLERALNKLLMGHFLRRYPLIFDGETYRIAAKTTPGPSLFSSLAHIQRLEVKHNLATGSSLLDSMARLALAQQNSLKARVHRAVSLPAKKDRKTEAAHKRQKVARERESAAGDGKDVAIDLYKVDRDERRGAYLEEVKASIDRSDKQGPRKAETKLKRIVGDAIVFLGRKDLEARRQGRRKLGYGRVKLVCPPDEDFDFPFSDYVYTTETPSQSSLPHSPQQVSFIEDDGARSIDLHMDLVPYDRYPSPSPSDELLNLHADASQDGESDESDMEGEEEESYLDDVPVDDARGDSEPDVPQLEPQTQLQPQLQLHPQSPLPRLYAVNDLHPPPPPVHPSFRRPIIELRVERFDKPPEVNENIGMVDYVLEETQVC
ncbi:hypothetical protein IAR50_004511 [Cryptococcus sp. DSM 104548]